MNLLVVCLLLTAIAGSCLAGVVRQTLFDQCTPVVEGVPRICVTATSLGCFELHAHVTVNNQTYLDQDLPIPRILQEIKFMLEHPPPGTPRNIVCYNYSAGALGHLGVCGNVTELSVSGDDLKFCGKVQFFLDSALLGKYNESLEVPCLDIKQCKLFGCPNNCSGKGTCGPFGCTCNKGYSGPDCSVFFNGTCVESDLVPASCWKAFFPDCRHVEFEVTSQGRELYKFESPLNEVSGVKLLPSTALVGFEPCKVDVVAQNITVKNDTLSGCPVIQVSCDELIVEEFNLDCMKLAQSSALICANNPPVTNPPPGPENTMSTIGAGRVAMYVAVGILVLALLGGGGYFVFVRFIRKSPTSGYGYDAVSNIGGEEDEDVGPLRSPFGGSSDEDQ